MSDLRGRLADALHRAMSRIIGGVAPDGMWAPEYLADVLLSLPGIAIVDSAAEERRVITPQGTHKPVGPDGVVGDRLRDLGWRIESRYVTDWLPVETTEAPKCRTCGRYTDPKLAGQIADGCDCR